MKIKEKINSAVDCLTTHSLSFDRIFAAFISSFFLSYIVQMFTNAAFFDLNNYYNSINFVTFWIIAVSGTFLLCLFTYATKQKSLIPRALGTTAFLLSFLLCGAYATGDVYFLLGIAIVDFMIVLWLTKDDKLELSSISLSYRTCLIIAGILFASTTVYFGYCTSLDYINFCNSTFDFGIFAQMFENMATTGLPLTTVERSVEMSHFGVHLSPIYYLLLPGYMLFRSPVYLLYAQAFCVALGVFAVYLICKKLDCSPKTTLCFEFIYCLYPCLFNGCFRDFHENKMLTTIILFLFYFILCEKRIPIIIFSLLLLMVKEDAAIYLIVIALYVLINRKKYINGTIMLSMAVVYFVFANIIIAALGSEGVMIGRLSDYFINGEQTYMSVFKSVLYNAGYLIKMMFTAEKFPFVIWMLLPVVFSPFFTNKISSLILLLPIIPINLMQSWKYQYDIDFQYTYGVAALIIISAILGISVLKKRPRHIALLMSLVLCACMTVNIISPKIKGNYSADNAYSQAIQTTEQALLTIPKDASVTASHYIAPHLYYIKELYTVPDYYKPIEQTDYMVVDNRFPDESTDMFTAMGNDYTLYKSQGYADIYKLN